MSFLNTVLAIYFLISFTECDQKVQIFIPCRKSDTICETVSGQLAFQNIIRGVPSLGIPSSDPIYVKEISGVLDKFVYNFTKVSTTGGKGCVVNLLRLDGNLVNLNLKLMCASATVKGRYDIDGELVGRKVDEASNFTLWTTSYIMAIDMKLNQKLEADGKKHLVIVNTTTHSTALGPLRAKLENSNDLEKFLNDHPVEIGDIVSRTFVDANMKKIAARANIFLKSVPVEDLFLKINFFK